MKRRFKNLIRVSLCLALTIPLVLSACGKESAEMFSEFAADVASDVIKTAISEGIERIVSENSSVSLDTVDSGEEFITLNGNKPFFTEEDISRSDESFEEYSHLDGYGRCGVAFANISPELMPTEKREGIGMVKPSGWNQAKYPGIIEGAGYVYNRCHLIAFELAGENANVRNLITGTRQMNLAMLPFENIVADYVRQTKHHVLYRVSPDFRDGESVARGVTMEAQSIEDGGCVFCVYIPNVQDGITIDYVTGGTKKTE